MDSSYEFDPTPPHWLVRVAKTPLSDALRGHFGGQNDARQEIAASGLPTPIADVIYTVVKRSRLWRSEKLDVAKELINHFSDGLAAGRTPEQLIADFGFLAPTVRLFRQAKLRQRPTAWQAWWYASRASLAIVTLLTVGYGLLAARFFMTRPNIAHNYWEDINASRSVPESERAWPLYREAILAVRPEDNQLISELLEQGEFTSPAVREITERNQKPLELARQAARRPQLGYLIDDPADHAAAIAAGQENVLGGSHHASENAPLIAMNLDGAQRLRGLARLLLLDAFAAAESGDGNRAAEDLRTLLALSAHTFQPHATLVEQLIGIGVFSRAVDTLGQILRDHAEVFSDEQLRDLAHTLASYRNGNIKLDLATEQLYFLDELQRIYSDDGGGGGRVTSQGLRELISLAGEQGSNYELPLAGPGLSALIANREDAEKFYREALEHSLAVRQGPPWKWNYDALEQADEQYQILNRNPLQRLRHALTLLLSPAVGAAIDVAERTIQVRDAAETAIALVLWQRRHVTWPERLDQLVPELLPALPLDRYDGQPLRYVVRDGKPLLYSVGHDRDDNSGQPTNPPENAIGRFEPIAPSVEANRPPMDPDSSSVSDYDGDWILWPPLPPEKPAAVDEDSTATETTPAP